MTPREMGKEAYVNNIACLAQDPKMMDYLSENKYKVGEGAQDMRDWNAGWREEQERELKERFPEMY